MSVYVISDIHGYFDRFMDVLKVADFDFENDTLYVLGDVADRGPQSAQCLKWAVNAPENIHFLMGNHEDLALPMLRWETSGYADEWLIDPALQSVAYANIWCYNGGDITLNQLRETTTQEWRKYQLIPWIENLPFYYHINVNDKEYLLVHAGIGYGRRLHDNFFSDGIDDYIDIPLLGEYREQWTQHLLWIREQWLYSVEDLPCDVIFGHTPTRFWIEDFKFWNNLTEKDRANVRQVIGDRDKICMIEQATTGFKKICIDTGRKSMGLLRLNDMKEFYSEV